MLNMFKVIQKNVPVASMRDLLMQEDSDGRRPLKYALHLGTSMIALQIFCTVGVHTANSEYHGTSITRWIDITDYEVNGNRRNRSPPPPSSVCYV